MHYNQENMIVRIRRVIQLAVFFIVFNMKDKLTLIDRNTYKLFLMVWIYFNIHIHYTSSTTDILLVTSI